MKNKISALRKKMAELQEAEVAKSVEKAVSKKKTSSARAPIVTDEDLTSGLLDVVPQTSKKERSFYRLSLKLERIPT